MIIENNFCKNIYIYIRRLIRNKNFNINWLNIRYMFKNKYYSNIIDYK